MTNFIFNRRQGEYEKLFPGNQQNNSQGENSDNQSSKWLHVLEKGSLGKQSLKELCPKPKEDEQETDRVGLIARVNLPSELIAGKNGHKPSGNVVFIIGGSGPEETTEMCKFTAEKENFQKILNYQDNDSNTLESGHQSGFKKVKTEGVDSFYVLFKCRESQNKKIEFNNIIDVKVT